MQFIATHDALQLNNEPSYLHNVLDLVLVPANLSKSVVHQLPPFGGSDHMVQVVAV
jgi:hypothetical protein